MGLALGSAVSHAPITIQGKTAGLYSIVASMAIGFSAEMGRV